MSGRLRRAVAIAAALGLCAAFAAALQTQGLFVRGEVLRVSPRLARRSAVAHSPWPQGTVDVNTATRETLLMLNGIGPTLADAVVAEREANGLFDYPEDLLAVKGIGEKKLARFRDQLRFSGQEP